MHNHGAEEEDGVRDQEEALRGLLIRIRCWLIRIIVTSLPNIGDQRAALSAGPGRGSVWGREEGEPAAA